MNMKRLSLFLIPSKNLNIKISVHEYIETSNQNPIPSNSWRNSLDFTGGSCDAML